MSGYIYLDRPLTDHWLWDDKPFARGQAWIDLLFLANYTDCDGMYDGRIIHKKRGDVNLSIRFLARRWGWSDNKVRRFLDLLESENMISQERNTYGTVITIENYNKYQVKRSKDGTPTEHPRNTEGEPTETYNKSKVKISKGKEETPIPLRNVIPPTLEMVRQYCEERHSNVDPDYFYDYYESRNWMLGKTKMKDWQASFRTWEKKNFNKQKKPFDLTNL